MTNHPTPGRPTGTAITPEAIKATRERLGMTQQQFAAAIGASWQAVASWEQGRKHPTGLYAKVVSDLIQRYGE